MHIHHMKELSELTPGKLNALKGGYIVYVTSIGLYIVVADGHNPLIEVTKSYMAFKSLEKMLFEELKSTSKVKAKLVSKAIAKDLVWLDTLIEGDKKNMYSLKELI